MPVVSVTVVPHLAFQEEHSRQRRPLISVRLRWFKIRGLQQQWELAEGKFTLEFLRD
jgi:hypothetical protein